jgi:hypothetical protein
MSDQGEFGFLSEVPKQTPEERKLTFNTGRVLFCLLLDPDEKTPKEMSKESGMLVNLVKKYPNQKFWSKIEFDFKVRSLAYFFTRQGDAEVRRLYSEFHFKQNLPPDVKETGKSGEDLDIIRKPKNIRKWLQE